MEGPRHLRGPVVAPRLALPHRHERLPDGARASWPPALPSGVAAPCDDADTPTAPSEPGVAWLEPIPDAIISPEFGDPAMVVASREGLRLALIAALQHLPARQRAVLILREVLAFPASEVAIMLDTTTAAVKSALQRARAQLDDVDPEWDQLTEPSEPRARALLEQYVAGFEHADIEALERALRTDAAIELVGTRTRFAGRVPCLRYLPHVIGAPGDWRMIPTRANGQPAAAAHHRDANGIHRAFGIGVLTVTPAGIGRIVVFGGGPGLVAKFGLPPSLSARCQRWLNGGQ